MDKQHLKHVHESEHDGVHVCHKCGWPFPNAHPSAKHRRAHKRICGTIEGYKLVDLEGSAHSNVSDEDRLSDEDHKTLSPKVLRASSYEKGSEGTRELTNRSEDEVFSDAAAEFSDSGFGAGSQERLVDAGESAVNVEKIVKSESHTIPSSECGPIAETIKSLDSATDSILIQHSETPYTTSNGSGNAPEFIETSSSCVANPAIVSVSDSRTEDSGLLNGNGNTSVDDSNTRKSETQKDVSEESEKTIAIGDVDGSLTLAEKGTDVEVKKENYLDCDLPDVTISPIKVYGETVEVNSKLGETLETNLEPLPAMPEDGLYQLQEKNSDGIHLKVPPELDVSTEIGSVVNVNASNDTAETLLDSAEGINYVNSGDLIEKKREVDANLRELSVPDDIHVVHNPEIMLEDFKDHKEIKLDQPANLELEQANDKGDDTKRPVLEESGLGLQSKHSEDTVVFASDRHVLEDSVQLDQERSMPTVKDVPVEGETDLSQIKVKIAENQRSDEIETPSDLVTPLLDKSSSVSSPEAQESYDVSRESFQDNFAQNAKTVISDEDSVIALSNAGIVKATSLVGLDDHAKVEKSVLSEVHNHNKGDREDDYTVSPVTATESASNGSSIEVNSANTLQEGDDTSYEKVEIRKDDLNVDAGDNAAALHVKNETEADNSNVPAKESFSEHPVVTPESAKRVSELQINLKSKLQKGDDACNFEKFELEKDLIAGGACGVAAEQVTDETVVDNSDGPSKKSFPEHAVVNPESTDKSSQLYVNPAANLREDSDDHKDRIEKCVEHGIDSKEGPIEETVPIQQKTIPESANHLQESQTVVEEVVLMSVEKSPVIVFTDLGGANVASDTQQGKTEHKLGGNDEVQDTVDNKVKEPAGSSLHAVGSSIHSSTVVGDNSAREFDATSAVGSESFQGGSDKQQIDGSVVDLSVDSISQTDSLEGNWGSVSVLSIQSDAQAVIDAETLPPTESQAAIGEENNSNQSKPVSEGQHPDKSETFEPPSFMTLVEPGSWNDQKSISDIRTGQNSQQPKSSSLQAGWFPSITHVVNESQGRKKNEEIIAKVTNWSTGKQHTPLKNLLGEASLDIRAKSPKRKENVAPDLHKGDKAETTVSILAPKSPLGQAANREIGKEWNSPARYPTEIKREKRKSRPYWVQFVCCSSVH
ncbi:Zinc finger, C2H [Parasponia andersonii]|uniref:Zinc finger, C2H n=1 Tax=Parasponia andersonii TaxID=3476 RepID=A0A2P5C3X5_PARAD|nr:Zinc finger, C2H [Parasponia andersonii]